MTTISAWRAVVASVLLFISANLHAQGDWPTRPISYVVPYPPGGTTDILGRLIGQRLGAALKTTVVVDNKAGATGTIGGAFVARSAPDGYTLLGTSIGPQAIVPHLMHGLSYDPIKGFSPVVLVGLVPHLLVVNAAAPYKSVNDLASAAKAAPGKLSFASGGNGTILQMQGELLRQRAGLDLIHVPYKGDVPALQDVMAGQATFVFIPISAGLQQVTAGRVRALAITSDRRASSLPDVPTMAEAGFKDFSVEQWQAIFAPAGTPATIVNRINKEVNVILKDPEVVATLEKLGVTIAGGPPDRLANTQLKDFERWGNVIRAAGITMDSK